MEIKGKIIKIYDEQQVSDSFVKQECVIEAKFSSSLKVSDWLLRNGFAKNSDEIVVKRKSYKK